MHRTAKGLAMRGTDMQQLGVFSYISVEERVPPDHPLRGIRKIVDQALRSLDGVLGAMYAKTGRSSVAPEKLIRALLLQVFYSIRSERQLMEQLDYNLLFRWFVGLNMDDLVWDHSTFSKNRDRLIEVDIARHLMLAVVE
jgi:transposase